MKRFYRALISKSSTHDERNDSPATASTSQRVVKSELPLEETMTEIWRSAGTTAMLGRESYIRSSPSAPGSIPVLSYAVTSSLPQELLPKDRPNGFTKWWGEEELKKAESWKNLITDLCQNRYSLAEAATTESIQDVEKRMGTQMSDDPRPTRDEYIERSLRHRKYPTLLIHSSATSDTPKASLGELTRKIAESLQGELDLPGEMEIQFEIRDKYLHKLFRSISITLEANKVNTGHDFTRESRLILDLSAGNIGAPEPGWI